VYCSSMLTSFSPLVSPQRDLGRPGDHDVVRFSLLDRIFLRPYDRSPWEKDPPHFLFSPLQILSWIGGPVMCMSADLPVFFRRENRRSCFLPPQGKVVAVFTFDDAIETRDFPAVHRFLMPCQH